MFRLNYQAKIKSLSRSRRFFDKASKADRLSTKSFFATGLKFGNNNIRERPIDDTKIFTLNQLPRVVNLLIVFQVVAFLHIRSNVHQLLPVYHIRRPTASVDLRLLRRLSERVGCVQEVKKFLIGHFGARFWFWKTFGVLRYGRFRHFSDTLELVCCPPLLYDKMLGHFLKKMIIFFKVCGSISRTSC
jgi:hypothetical protein